MTTAAVKLPTSSVFCINDHNECLARFYRCQEAGRVPSGTRVNDVYKIAGQMIKSIGYCMHREGQGMV
jgi:hypothetical protein